LFSLIFGGLHNGVSPLAAEFSAAVSVL